MNTKLTPAIYERDEVKRCIERIEAREKRIEQGENSESLVLWMTDEGERLFMLEGDDRLAEPATCIYSPKDGGRLIE